MLRNLGIPSAQRHRAHGGALKEARAVAAHYEKLAIHYLALVQISMIRLLVRRLERPLSHKA